MFSASHSSSLGAAAFYPDTVDTQLSQPALIAHWNGVHSIIALATSILTSVFIIINKEKRLSHRSAPLARVVAQLYGWYGALDGSNTS